MKFSGNFETILVNLRFQFCLAAEFMALSYPMISQTNCASQNEWPYNKYLYWLISFRSKLEPLQVTKRAKAFPKLLLLLQSSRIFIDDSPILHPEIK